MTIHDKVVPDQREPNGLILESGDMPSIIDPVLDIVRVLEETKEIHLGIMQSQVQDLVHVAVRKPGPRASDDIGDILDIVP